jgi:hypothetical protein
MDDVEAFFAPGFMTGPLCGCHGPCHDDPGCEEGAGASGSGAEFAQDLPDGCELAGAYLSHVPPDYAYGMCQTLIDYITEHPDDPQAERMLDFLACLTCALP